jgi:hypothetical protein
MPQFRKKPVVIEAVNWNGHALGLTNHPVDLSQPRNPAVRLEMPAWMPKCHEPLETEALTKAAVSPGEVWRFADSLYIGTLEGTHCAMPGDWIIRGVKGEIYPCKPDIFAATYDAADAKHEGLPVAGYKPQNNIAVDLVNQNKRLEENVLRVLDDLATMKGPAASNAKPSELTVDQRWLAIGRTAIEQGFMAVNRAVFQPGRVKLPGDRLPG